MFKKFICFLELFHLPEIHDAKQREEKLTFTQIRAVGIQVHYIDERLHEFTSLRAGGRVDKPPRPMKVLTALSASSHNLSIEVPGYTMKEDGCSGHELFNIKHCILYIVAVTVLMHTVELKMQQTHSCRGHAHSRIKLEMQQYHSCQGHAHSRIEVFCHQVDS